MKKFSLDCLSSMAHYDDVLDIKFGGRPIRDGVKN